MTKKQNMCSLVLDRGMGVQRSGRAKMMKLYFVYESSTVSTLMLRNIDGMSSFTEIYQVK